MTLSIAIIHAPWSTERAANVRDLLEQLPGALVVDDVDREGSLKVGNRRGCWPLARWAWCAADPTATHHLVLEDDAQLCDGFLSHVESAIAREPAACLSLFRGARDCSVATIMPVPIIAEWLTWVRESPRGVRLLPHHDYLIAAGMRDLGVRRLFAEPSLVEHRAFPSLLEHDHVRARAFEQTPRDFCLEA